jgi:hypothetical protein
VQLLGLLSLVGSSELIINRIITFEMDTNFYHINFSHLKIISVIEVIFCYYKVIVRGYSVHEMVVLEELIVFILGNNGALSG